MSEWKTVYMDTANMSGIDVRDYEINEAGEILRDSRGWQHQVLEGWGPSRRMTFKELLAGGYCGATYHLKKTDAIKAQHRRLQANFDHAKALLEAA